MKNEYLQSIIRDLEILSKKQKVAIWKRIAQELQKPTRSRRTVNVSKLAQYAKDGETMIVPGKVLGVGETDKAIRVVAYEFSQTAKEKILAQKGTCKTIVEEMKKNPKGNKLRIIG
ncbi:MAG: 50S ribosomal protein L18e [Candidatus Woesearchaeota archaeon]